MTEITTEELKKIIGMSEPWNLIDVLNKLIEASEILLHKESYDGHGHEEINICVAKGKEYSNNITTMLKTIAEEEKPEEEVDMDIYSPEGTKIIVTKQSIASGYEYDREHARKHLKIDCVYTVEKTEVNSWHTDVYLKEFPGEVFNSVSFLKYKKQE